MILTFIKSSVSMISKDRLEKNIKRMITKIRLFKTMTTFLPISSSMNTITNTICSKKLSILNTHNPAQTLTNNNELTKKIIPIYSAL
jgi:hypothetical protein